MRERESHEGERGREGERERAIRERESHEEERESHEGEGGREGEREP